MKVSAPGYDWQRTWLLSDNVPNSSGVMNDAIPQPLGMRGPAPPLGAASWGVEKGRAIFWG
jgi:hypothetical protein